MNDLIIYFKNCRDNRRKIGKASSEKEALKIIHQFLDEHKFQSYYTRSWINESSPNEKIYDVGSHTEFFICYNPNGWSEI